MESNQPATQSQSQATQQSETTATQKPPTFTPAQVASIDRAVARAVARAEDAHRREKASLQERLDKAAAGTLNESDELARLKNERDEARAETKRLQDEKRKQQVLSNFRRNWRDAGLPEDRKLMAALGNAYIGIDESGEPVVNDEHGRPRHGVTVTDFLAEVRADYSTLQRQDSNPSNPSGSVPRGARPKSKEDFGNDTKAKMDYIDRFGLAAWEKLPTK